MTYEQMGNLTYEQLKPAEPEEEVQLCYECDHPYHGTDYNSQYGDNEGTCEVDGCLCVGEWEYVCHCFDDPTIWEDDEDE